MRALVVGADRVDAIRNELIRSAHLGITCAEHWSGRHVHQNRKPIPIDTRVVVVLCNRVSHDLLYSIKRQAASRDLVLVFCRHSVVELRDKLSRVAARVH
ncbi:hypothetical protein [Thauera sp. Sel9]|uniref:hypothetical protein n=1 Tax=Thauera sp. Sel9 TaxID=2974299 RepID=UPI0021E14A51|nr:hypothetical protein [Thauera sp. Sel9]MCV2217118.1 hypothetical protein [Thauera sp. Sel9]